MNLLALYMYIFWSDFFIMYEPFNDRVKHAKNNYAVSTHLCIAFASCAIIKLVY